MQHTAAPDSVCCAEKKSMSPHLTFGSTETLHLGQSAIWEFNSSYFASLLCTLHTSFLYQQKRCSFVKVQCHTQLFFSPGSHVYTMVPKYCLLPLSSRLYQHIALMLNCNMKVKSSSIHVDPKLKWLSYPSPRLIFAPPESSHFQQNAIRFSTLLTHRLEATSSCTLSYSPTSIPWFHSRTALLVTITSHLLQTAVSLQLAPLPTHSLKTAICYHLTFLPTGHRSFL